MSSAVKYKWPLKQYGRFIHLDKTNEETLGSDDSEKNNREDFCKNGIWKVTENEKGDLNLFYLEAEHLMVTKKNVILESFTLIESNQRMRGIYKNQSLMVVEQFEDGCRRFRLEFDETDDNNAIVNCNDCITKLKLHFPLRNNDLLENCFEDTPLEKINEALLDKVQVRKLYANASSCNQLSDLVLLCLIDSSFPHFVTQVQNVLKGLN